MSYMTRVYRTKFLESNGLDPKLIEVTLKTDLNRIQDYLNNHKCLNYFEAEELLLDFWLSSEDKKNKKYIGIRVLINKASVNSKRLLKYWTDRKRKDGE